MLELAAGAVRGCNRVLEVAAGTGLVTLALARAAHEVVATDYADAMLTTLTRRLSEAGLSNVHAQQADLYALPFEAASFDAVVAANVLHLVPDLPRAIASLRRVLQPGRSLVVPTFCHDETALSWVVSRALAVTGFPGQRRFSAASLRAALEREGLQITREELLPGLIPIVFCEGRFSG
jgi:ubiquinone/menaquinone biosynthesis C-methylase UbiE